MRHQFTGGTRGDISHTAEHIGGRALYNRGLHIPGRLLKRSHHHAVYVHAKEHTQHIDKLFKRAGFI